MTEVIKIDRTSIRKDIWGFAYNYMLPNIIVCDNCKQNFDHLYVLGYQGYYCCSFCGGRCHVEYEKLTSHEKENLMKPYNQVTIE